MSKKLMKLKEQQENIFIEMAKIIGGIAAPVRIKLIHFLSQGPLTVDTLSEKINQSVANTSMHLRKMLNEKIVKVSAQGQKRFYSLHPATLEYWEASQDFIQKINPELKLDFEEVYGDLNWSEDILQTLRRVKKNEVVLLDVRPIEEVGEEIDGLPVLNIPSSEVHHQLKKIPKKKPVLVFCRGRMCALSAHTVNELRESGINAYRLNDSWYSLKKKMKS